MVVRFVRQYSLKIVLIFSIVVAHLTGLQTLARAMSFNDWQKNQQTVNNKILMRNKVENFNSIYHKTLEQKQNKFTVKGVFEKKLDKCLTLNKTAIKYAKKMTEAELKTRADKLFKKGHYCKAGQYYQRLFDRRPTDLNLRIEIALKTVESLFLGEDYIEVINVTNSILVYEKATGSADNFLLTKTATGWSASLPEKSPVTSGSALDYSWFPEKGKEYLHYLLLRSVYRAYLGKHQNDEYLQYLIGEHDRQRYRNSSEKLNNLSIYSYLKRYTEQTAWRTEIEALRIRAYELLFDREITISQFYANQDKKYEGVIIKMIKTPAENVNDNFASHISTLQRVSSIHTRIPRDLLKHSEVLQKIFIQSLAIAKDTYKKISALNLDLLSSENIKKLLHLVIHPAQGQRPAYGVELGSKTAQLLKTEFDQAFQLFSSDDKINFKQSRETLMGFLIHPEMLLKTEWPDDKKDIYGLIEYLRKLNKKRVIVQFTDKKANLDDLSGKRWVLKHMTEEAFKKTYFYQKFQQYPFRDPRSYYAYKETDPKFFDAIKSSGINEQSFDEKILTMVTNNTNYTSLIHSQLYLSVSPIKNYKDPKYYRVSFLWEDIPTAYYTKEQALEEARKYMKSYIKQYNKIIAKEGSKFKN